MKKSILTLLATLLAVMVFSQTKNNPWQDVAENTFAQKSAKRNIVPSQYRTLSLDQAVLEKILVQAPLRFTPEAEASPTLRIPMPQGAFQSFNIVEAPIMHPELAAKYPYIRSYAGWSLEDPTAYLRFGVTHKGFHAVIFSARHSTVFIDLYAEGDTEHYICYFKKDFSKDDLFECHTEGLPESELVLADSPVAKAAGDCKLRTYALALACTGEYAQFHGGTVPSVMAAYAIAMTRVNGIYERDLSVTMELVPNTDLLIFLNASTDPYTNGNGNAMLTQNQQTCNSIIGSANYDIGHVFSTGGGGVAFLNAVCSNNNKARGVTGQSVPTGDPFWVDYVAHEMGHQFGGNHTQNNSCNRNNATAMEPGSASTIMGYAGICSPNVQNNSDDYFHAINLDEITAHITGFGNTCATSTITGNNNPFVTVPSGSYAVPVSTPLVLTAMGSDPDGDVLTYCWEQMNNEVATMPPKATNIGGPAFRSLPPVESPSRYLPNLPSVISGQTPLWEVLPAVSRTMLFRCTVRDHRPGAGCTAETDVVLNFTASAGPFLVSNPNVASVTWFATSQATVSWDVANTNLAPVNCSEVDILLSVDGGFTYPYLLLAQTPNDGSQDVIVPNVETNQARVMVRARNNIFYDISDQNFTILQPLVPDFLLAVDPAKLDVCLSGEASYSLALQPIAGFDENVEFSASGLPDGATVIFSPNNTTPPAVVTMTVNNLQSAAAGDYLIAVTAASPSATHVVEVVLTVVDSLTQPVTLFNPADDATGQLFDPTPVTWFPLAGADAYKIEVSLNPSFQNIFHAGTTNDTGYQIPGTEEGTVYYWRVRGVNICNEGPFSVARAFQTGKIKCEIYASTKTPLPIPGNAATTVSDAISVPSSGTVASIKVTLDIAHTYLGDLTARMESAQGTQVVIFDRPGVPATTYGCSGDDMLVNFYDEAPNDAEAFENTCNSSVPAIAGDYRPIDPFGVFQGQESLGSWTLFLEDAFEEDGGEIKDWFFELCTVNSIAPALLIEKDTLLVKQGQSELVTKAELEASGAPGLTVFTLLTLPAHGSLVLLGNPLQIGDSFTQAQINAGLLAYQHDGGPLGVDFFLFDVLDETNGWLHAQIFFIKIIENPLAAIAVLTKPIDCHNADNAAVNIAATGGVAPLSYSLNGGSFQPESIFENLIPGTYTAEVMDASGVIFTTNSVMVSNPALIIASASVDDDDVTITAAGGTGNLQYSLNGGAFQNSNSFENLPNGFYTITVKDANGCTSVVTAMVSISSLVISAAITQPISCFGVADGEITVGIISGTPPFNFSLNGGVFQDNPVFQNLSAGSYMISVQDGDGFLQTTLPLLVTAPPALVVTPTVSDSTVTLHVSGGTSPYQYQLGGGGFQLSNVFINVPDGVYIVDVVDANGCEAGASVTVVNVQPLVISAVLEQGITCFGDSTAVVSVNAAGGLPPFLFSLNGGAFQSGNVFSGLPAGTYQAVVQDANGTAIMGQAISVTSPPAITASASSAGFAITVIAAGGTGTLQYNLDGGAFQNSNVFQVSSNGVYNMTVMDGNGCTAMTSATVYVLSGVQLSVNNPSCFGLQDAVISVLGVSGGTPPYLFSLNGGLFSTNSIFSGLEPGDYTVTVQDANSNQYVAPPVTVESVLPVEAVMEVNGNTLTILASGGTGSYQYSIDGGQNYQSSNIFPNLPNNGYEVIVADGNGCAFGTTVIININLTEEVGNRLLFDVLPNPSDGFFILRTELSLPSVLQLEVFDLAGRLVFQKKMQAHGRTEEQLDLRSLAGGSYELRVSDAKNWGVKRLVIVK